MRKSLLFYIVSFVLLMGVLIFFNRAFRQLSVYSEYTNRHHTVYNNYQELSDLVNNAAILTPDLVKKDSAPGIRRIFYADTESIIRQLNLLKGSVRDSVNVAIAGQLDLLVRSELSWLLASSVPDSIIQNKATGHIASFRKIDSLITQGMDRTNFLVQYRKQQVDTEIRKVRTGMVVFIVLSGVLLLYAILNLFNQQLKGRRQEKEIEVVLNRIHEGVVSVDKEWRYTFLNDAAMANHPGNKKEVIGKVIWDIHPEMKGTIFWDKYHEAMITRQMMEIDSYYEPMDIWFSVKVYPSADGLTIFYKNVTESKRAEQKLRQTLREVTDYKFALDESSIVAITDQKGFIKHANKNFCRISRYTLDKLVGQDHRIINSGHHPKEFIKDIWTTIANGRIWKGELKNKAKDGTIYWVDTTIVPFLNEEGKPCQYVAISSDITERKLAEENLQKSLKELADYKYALDESSIVAITDQEGIIRHVNDNFCRISRYRREELIGQDHRIINSGYHPGDFIHDLWVTITKGKIWKGELKNKAKGGAIYWVDTTIVPLLNEKGKPYQYLAIGADITEGKHAEDGLASSEMRFRALIENSSEGISLTDRYSNNIYRSPAAQKMMGELPKGNTLGLTHPADMEVIRSKYELVLKSPGMPVGFQGRFLHASGQYVWLEGTLTNLLHVKEVNALVTNFRNITERKEAEEKLIKSEEIYKTIASSIPGSVICLLDPNFRFLLIEGDMLEKIGYSKKQLLGNKIQDVVPPEIFAVTRKNFEKALRGETVTVEATRQGVDLISRYIPLKDKNGVVYAIMTVAIDISELKQAQRHVIELNHNLEEKIQQRTEELKKSNRELEAFSYSVSHDLRAPLRGIIGFTTILEEDYCSKLDDDAKRITSVIKTNTMKMGYLIDDLLAFSRTGKQELMKTTVDTDSMVNEIINDTNQPGIHWDIHELLPVNADINLLRQVWVNLVSNAVKYSRNNKQSRIEIGSCVNDGFINFYVRDNGVGFDTQYSGKLFKVFQRLHAPEEFEGTGVGLALVEKIVSRHGGKVWAEGRENEGACFYFSLPA